MPSTPLGDPSALVQQGIVSSQGFSVSAVTQVNALVTQIGSMLNTIGSIPLVDANLGSLTNTVSSFDLPNLPLEPAIDTTFPTASPLLTVVPNFPSQVGYSDSLVTQLSSVLADLVANTRQTGLSAGVEQQIWDKTRERTTATAQGSIDFITRQFSRAGWNIPQGDQIERTYQAMEDKVSADITESRSTAIAQAELEQKNYQFTFTQAVDLQKLLASVFTSLQERLVTTEKERINALLETNKISTEVYKTSIDAVTSEVQSLVALYTGRATVYSAEARALSERTTAQVAIQENEINYLSKKADLAISVTKANAATFLTQKELVLGTLKTVAQVEAQLAASFGSAVSYSAGISGNTSSSDSRSTSTSTSQSNSNSTSEVHTTSG